MDEPLQDALKHTLVAIRYLVADAGPNPSPFLLAALDNVDAATCKLGLASNNPQVGRIGRSRI